MLVLFDQLKRFSEGSMLRVAVLPDTLSGLSASTGRASVCAQRLAIDVTDTV